MPQNLAEIGFTNDQPFQKHWGKKIIEINLKISCLTLQNIAYL
jgi:hypothetical protein